MKIELVVGIVAASITVVGTLWTLARRFKSWSQEIGARFERLEIALKTHKQVKVKKSQLVGTATKPQEVIVLTGGEIGSLVRLENNIADVRLNNSQTTIEIPLVELEVVE